MSSDQTSATPPATSAPSSSTSSSSIKPPSPPPVPTSAYAKSIAPAADAAPPAPTASEPSPIRQATTVGTVVSPPKDAEDGVDLSKRFQIHQGKKVVASFDTAEDAAKGMEAYKKELSAAIEAASEVLHAPPPKVVDTGVKFEKY